MQLQIFLINQSNFIYKMLSNLAAQQQPVKSIHELTINDIQTFMAEHFDPKRFVERVRFKFWSDMEQKPGKNIPELASRIQQDAATSDFKSVKDPLDQGCPTLGPWVACSPQIFLVWPAKEFLSDARSY